MNDKTISTVGVFLTEDERGHLIRLCNELEVQEEDALRCKEGPEAQTRSAERAALLKLMGLRVTLTGFVPTLTERDTLGLVHDGALPLHTGDLTRRLVRRILSCACPVQSNECAIRGMCTNKCGALNRCEVNLTAGTWTCPTCGDPTCGEV